MKPVPYALALAMIAASATPALAHLDPMAHGSFAAGLSHPLFGADHLLAMMAVGFWAASYGSRAGLALPAGFVLVMTAGYLVALAGLPVPLVEPVILSSVLLLGLALALALRPALSLSLAAVAFFGFFHGHAHGTEIGSAGALAYGLGFALATAALHVGGFIIATRLTTRLDETRGPLALRGLGVFTLLGGVAMAVA